jgi:hypothetical protein
MENGSSMTMWVNFLVRFALHQDNHHITVVSGGGGNNEESNGNTTSLRKLVSELSRIIPVRHVREDKFESSKKVTQESLDIIFFKGNNWNLQAS